MSSVGNYIKELKKDIAASLFIIPASLDDLMERDFLKNKSPEGIDRLLMAMENDGWIFFRNDIYYTYKKFAMGTEMKEYGLI